MKPLDQIILFDGEAPRRGYISSTAMHAHISRTCDGNPCYFVTPDEADAIAGRSYWLDARKLKPSSPALWAACTEYIRRLQQLKQDLVILSRGKTPTHYYQQYTLFTGDHQS